MLFSSIWQNTAWLTRAAKVKVFLSLLLLSGLKIYSACRSKLNGVAKNIRPPLVNLSRLASPVLFKGQER